jgi:hypothetical protein
MPRWVRLLLLGLIALLLVLVVIGLAAGETGAVEKISLAAAGVLLLLAAFRLRRETI